MRNSTIQLIKAFVIPILLFSTISCDKTFLGFVNPKDSTQEQIAQELVEKVEYSPERLFKMSSFGVNGFSSASQGMDIYNDAIMFQAGYSGSSMYIHILDLDNHNLLGTIQFYSPDGKASHMNNINCGEKYQETDKFPLLYLSQMFNSRYCYVLHIANDASSYELVQTIKYEGSKYHTNGSYYDWCIDVDNKLIYTYGYYKGDKLNREMVKFPLPDLDKAEVIFKDNNALGSLIINNISIHQGSKIIKGLLYIPVGAGNGTYPGRLLTIDLSKKVLIRDGTLNCGEPESIGQYKDGFIICGGKGNPYYYFVKP